jgi:hypothetical protein
MELDQLFVVVNGADKAAMVQLALALNTWPLFGAFLMTGLLGFFLSLPLLALALLRAKTIPWPVLALALVPVVLGLLPIPDTLASLVSPLFMVLPCLWISAQLARAPQELDQPTPAVAIPAPGAAA